MAEFFDDNPNAAPSAPTGLFHRGQELRKFAELNPLAVAKSRREIPCPGDEAEWLRNGLV